MGTSWPLPYRVFYDLVPGFRAIRVPARLGCWRWWGWVGWRGWASISSGVGGGPGWLAGGTRRVGWLDRRLVVGALAVAVVLLGLGVESLTRMQLPDPPPTSNPPPAYAWISAHPAPTLELPMGDGPVASAWPNFWSMFHWNQVVNGYSGIVPPTYYPFRERMRTFPTGDTVALLQGIGVQNVILHADFPGPGRAAVEAQLAANPAATLAQPAQTLSTACARPVDVPPGRAAPDGETVDLPNAAADPVALGLLMAVLNAADTRVTGRGQIDYLTLSPAESPRCYAILPTGAEPPPTATPARRACRPSR